MGRDRASPVRVARETRKRLPRLQAPSIHEPVVAHTRSVSLSGRICKVCAFGCGMAGSSFPVTTSRAHDAVGLSHEERRAIAREDRLAPELTSAGWHLEGRSSFPSGTDQSSTWPSGWSKASVFPSGASASPCWCPALVFRWTVGWPVAGSKNTTVRLSNPIAVGPCG